MKLYPRILSTDIEEYTERCARNNENKKKRRDLLSEFIKDENSLGWELKYYFDDLEAKMRVKETVPEDHMLYPYVNTFWSIIPGFFKLYNFLQNNVMQNNKDFSFKVIFRTLGSDHRAIYDEFREFCKGRHPFFKNKYPEDRIAEIKYENCANVIRSTTDIKDVVLISGLFPDKYVVGKTRDYIFDTSLTKEEIIERIIKLLDEEHADKSVSILDVIFC